MEMKLGKGALSWSVVRCSLLVSLSVFQHTLLVFKGLHYHLLLKIITESTHGFTGNRVSGRGMVEKSMPIYMQSQLRYLGKSYVQSGQKQ